MTPERLQELKALCDEATQADWEVLVAPELNTYAVAVKECMSVPHVKLMKNVMNRDNRPSDAAFIAAARTAVPALIEEVERLRKQLAHCKEQRNIYHTICDENDLVNYLRHIKALDAEIEAIK